MNVMKRICSWCKKVIEFEKNDQNTPISHGICSDCYEMFDYKVSTLDQFLNSLQMPVFLVDQNVVVESANSLALDVIHKSIQSVQAQLGGDILDCIYSALPGGCGQSIHCSGCVIRNSVQKTFSTGEPVIEAESFNYLKTSKGIIKMRVLISTEKIGKRILLQIHTLTPLENASDLK
jgi:hypothetical protein